MHRNSEKILIMRIRVTSVFVPAYCLLPKQHLTVHRNKEAIGAIETNICVIFIISHDISIRIVRLWCLTADLFGLFFIL